MFHQLVHFKIKFEYGLMIGVLFLFFNESDKTREIYKNSQKH